MKKAIILTIMFALVALTGWAQDRLIRVDSDPEARHTSRQRALFNQEKKRLLMPLDAAFGVECVPSIRIWVRFRLQARANSRLTTATRIPRILKSCA